tara:strand:- start:6629 stop:7006 length:378 start_codon:yes stop_codon:yes gene_type:complete
MPELPEIVEAYISAYNARDIDRMIACLADEIHFRNFSGTELTAEAVGTAAFADLARFGASAFASRRQTVTHAISVFDTTVANIDFVAVVAMDLPNGWKAGQELSFKGSSLFRIANGKIVNIIDQS